MYATGYVCKCFYGIEYEKWAHSRWQNSGYNFTSLFFSLIHTSNYLWTFAQKLFNLWKRRLPAYFFPTPSPSFLLLSSFSVAFMQLQQHRFHWYQLVQCLGVFPPLSALSSESSHKGINLIFPPSLSAFYST